MWLSKKEYNEVVKTVNNMIDKIEELEGKVSSANRDIKLIKEAHNDRIGRVISKYVHETIATDTDNIDNITLQELASYIIDHKPIERKEKIEVTKKYF